MKSRLEKILQDVRDGRLSPEDALQTLKSFPYEDLDFAKIDHHRELRRGMPEIIFGMGKTAEQIEKISRVIIERGSNLLVTRVAPDIYRKIQPALPEIEYHPTARVITHKTQPPPPGKGLVAIITAGTSDIPVAEEAAITCDLLGNRIDRIFDVGVAGIHRLFGEFPRIQKARVIITAAGMEGALPSVIAGLVQVPVIAVPTSVGYGAHFQGVTALLAMLNSCPGGMAVVNIDNGFGAAYMASLINHLP